MTTTRGKTRYETSNQQDNLYPTKMVVQLGSYDLDLDVPDGVWNPTPHGIHLGNTIAEMDFSGQHVLELGTGCGLHAIVLAERGADRLTLTEIEAEILANARHNLDKHGVGTPTEYLVADWTHVPGEGFDVLVTNPPFAKSGKRYRRYFIDTLILDAHKLVRPGGSLIYVQSSMADIPRSLDLMAENGMDVEVLSETDHTFRPYYFDDPKFLLEMAAIPGSYTIRDGQHYERLIVLRATLPG